MYDMKNLARLKTLDANAPEAMQAFWAFDKAAMAPGAISVKHKELMALAVALTTQCPYCLDIHAAKARDGRRRPYVVLAPGRGPLRQCRRLYLLQGHCRLHG